MSSSLSFPRVVIRRSHGAGCSLWLTRHGSFRRRVSQSTGTGTNFDGGPGRKVIQPRESERRHRRHRLL
jgi:hypothetical protein